MTNRFLISVAAAALIAGTGFANAQGAGTSSSGGAAAQQSSPSSMNRDSGGSAAETKGSPSGEMKGAQSGDKTPEVGKNQRAQDNNMQGQKGMSAEGAKDSKDMKAEGRGDSKMNNAQSKDSMSKEGRSGTTADTKSGATDTKSGTTADTKSGATGSQTTGNAATSATAAPPAEKRTQIVSAIRSEKSITETTNVNFNIAVGVAVPASVRFHPLPPRIVEIYPEWRGYEVILVRGKYVIVRPQTREIVYIIEG